MRARPAPRPPARLVGRVAGLLSVPVVLAASGAPAHAAGAGLDHPTPRLRLVGAQAQRVTEEVMLGGLAAAALAVVVIIVVAFGGKRGARTDAVDRSIEAYTRAGARKRAQAEREAEQDAGSGTVAKNAVAVAESVLEGRQGLEAALADRLDAAGSALKPAEWLLAHLGTVVISAALALLLSGGSVVVTVLALVIGAAGPWLFLSIRRTRRLRAFGSGLADTLQLMAGSLSAGLSLAQSVDTVVREGADPIAGEFRRALVEARLGVDIEEALTGIAQRMNSVDFEWVVMAIRIQREVGGNLSELLTKVADTIREREYLVRQVKTLSAEGRLSVWILGGLPPAFMAYLAVANPTYLAPMFSSPPGLVLVGIMGVLLVAGVAWMKKVTKVDV